MLDRFTTDPFTGTITRSRNGEFYRVLDVIEIVRRNKRMKDQIESIQATVKSYQKPDGHVTTKAHGIVIEIQKILESTGG